MTKIYSISNHKGGVGKTTSTLNIGAGLHKLGKKVLLVDLDPQASLSQSLGEAEHEITIYDYLKRSVNGDPLEMQPIKILEGFDLIPASLELSGAEIEISSESGREYILKDILDTLKESYDFILIDCPPSLGLLTINAFTASNEILVPLQAEYLATQGVNKLIEVMEKIKRRLNKELKIGGLFVTQYDKRKILNRDVVDHVRTLYPEQVFNSMIRDNVALAEAPTRHLDIFRYEPKSFGAEDYLDLCREILKV